MTRIMLGVSGALIAALFLTVQWGLGKSEDLQAERQRSADLRMELEEKELALDVARASASFERQKARELDAIKESLLRGGEDVELPKWYTDWLADAGLSLRPEDRAEGATGDNPRSASGESGAGGESDTDSP